LGAFVSDYTSDSARSNYEGLHGFHPLRLRPR
jgi:hypothetical protein